MPGRGLTVSPVVRQLLELAERRADGQIRIDGRAVIFRDGGLARVEPEDSEALPPGHLLRSEQLTSTSLARARAKSEEKGTGLIRALRDQNALSEDKLNETQIGLWADRLARMLEPAFERSSHEAPDLEPLPEQLPDAEEDLQLVPVLLEALTRISLGLAGKLSKASRSRIFSFRTGPHRAAAEEWFRDDIPDQPDAFCTKLTQNPAFAARVAALLRAGLGDLQALPEPTGVETEGVLEGRLAPAKPNAVDVLTELERSVVELEERGAPAEERAAGWRRIGRAWRSSLHSLSEAARAYREAAAADPKDLSSLEQAADLCRIMGDIDLARAYARAAVRASNADQLGRAYGRLARLSIHAEDYPTASTAYRDAASHGAVEAPFHWLASAKMAGGDTLSDLVDAVTALDSPPPEDGSLRLQTLVLGELVEVLPLSLSAWMAFADALAKDGRAGAAVAIRRVATTWTTDRDTLRRLRIRGAEIAEEHGYYSDAASLLREAFDANPNLDTLHSALAADADALPLAERKAVLLEAIALASGERMSSYWLTLAADAFLDAEPDCREGIELHFRALQHDPGAPRPLEALRDYADRTGDFILLAQALEAALRSEAECSEAVRDDMAVELSILAEEALSSPALALWARQLRPRPDSKPPKEDTETLEGRLRERRLAIEELTNQLDGSVADPARTRLRRLAVLLRDDPNRREEAIDVHEQLHQASPDETTTLALDRLYRLSGKQDARVRLALKEASRLAAHEPRRQQQLRHAAMLEAHLERPKQVAELSRTLLNESNATNRLAVARLEQVGRSVGDDPMLLESLHLACSLYSGPMESSLLHDLTLASQRSGESIAALDAAVEALDCDEPGQVAPVGALFAFQQRSSLEREVAAKAVEHSLKHFGSTAALVRANNEVRPLRATDPQAPSIEELELLATVAPLDPTSATAFLSAAVSSGDRPRSEIALAIALECTAVPEAPILAALNALASDPPDADTVFRAFKAVENRGAAGPGLIEHMLSVTAASPELSYQIAGLERALLFQPNDEQSQTLRAIASLHQTAGDRAAETRTYVRLLALEGPRPETLKRLSELYAEAGEGDRLHTVLELRKEAARSNRELLERTFDLASYERLYGDSQVAERELVRLLDSQSWETPDLCRISTALAELGASRAANDRLLSIADSLDRRAAEPVYLHAVSLLDRYGNDPKLTASTAKKALLRCHGPAPLLVLFERSCLEQGDSETAQRVYEELILEAMGPHGQRALMYRMARWLELAGHPSESLKMYLKAFQLAPKSGAVFNAIDRLAHQTAEYEPLCEAMLLRAQHTRSTLDKAMWLRGAAQLREEPLRDPESAFWLLVESLRLLNDPTLADHARRLIKAAQKASEAPEALRKEMATHLVSVLEERLEQTWDSDSTLSQLRRLAELYGTELGNMAQASKYVDRMVAEGGAEEHAATNVNALLWLAEKYRDLGDQQIAQERVSQALGILPTHERANTVAANLTQPVHETKPMFRVPPNPADSFGFDSLSPAGMSQGPQQRVQRPREDGTDPAPMLYPATGLPRKGDEKSEDTAPLAPVSPRPPKNGADRQPVESAVADQRDNAAITAPPSAGREASLRAGLEAGDLDDAEQLAALLSTDDHKAHEAKDILLTLLSQQPGRPRAIRLLHTVATNLGATTLAATTAELMALFDNSVAAQTPVEPNPALCAFVASSPPLFTDPDLVRWGNVFALLWTEANPLFRQLGTELSATEAVPESHPIARHFQSAAAQLELPQPNLRFASGQLDESDGLVRLYRTYPPTILISPRMEERLECVPFLAGDMALRALPSHLILETSTAQEANDLITALLAAFGQPGSEQNLTPGASTLTAELWNTLTPRQQSRMRILLGSQSQVLRLEDFYAGVDEAAARAGLLIDGGVRSSVAALKTFDPTLQGFQRTSEEAFVEACNRSPALATMVSFALSNTYLAARARTVSSKPPTNPVSNQIR